MLILFAETCIIINSSRFSIDEIRGNWMAYTAISKSIKKSNLVLCRIQELCTFGRIFGIERLGRR